MQIERILVPVDFSGCSLAAAQAAATLASGMDARVFLLHIPELPGPITPDALIHPEPGAKEIPVSEYFQRKATESFKPYRALFGDRLAAELVKPAKRPAEVIIDVADEHNVDVIVMGTHGRRGLQRLLMGSVTETVLRQTARPVLVIRGTDAAEPSA